MPTVQLENNTIVLRNIIYVRNNRFHKFDLSDEQCQSTIIHEMCHAIKTHGHIKVENDIVTVSSGLLKVRYQYNSLTGRFDDLDAQNVELEEAINTYDELNIMRMMKGNSFHKQSGYATMVDTAQRMMQVDDIANIIRLSQFSGNDEWMEYLGEDTCNEIIDSFSKLCVNIGHNKGKSLRQRIRESKEAKEKLQELFNNYINRNIVSDNNYETKKEEYNNLSESRNLLQKLEHEQITVSLSEHEQAGRTR